jgi:hypothetical protein
VNFFNKSEVLTYLFEHTEAVMVSTQTCSVIERAKRIYEDRLRAPLEADHLGRFVAVEPESGEYFLADTFDAAVAAARAAHPTRLPHVMRVGHPAALHIGGAWS